MDVSVDGRAAGHTAGGHVGVILGVNVLQALPWDTRAELWRENTEIKGTNQRMNYKNE